MTQQEIDKYYKDLQTKHHRQFGPVAYFFIVTIVLIIISLTVEHFIQ